MIDHGYGLMSLYGHLSSIGVREGQPVQRGQELGRSGKTGLAGGDHLHFTTLLRGLPVNPVEWWDPHWIQDRHRRASSERPWPSPAGSGATPGHGRRAGLTGGGACRAPAASGPRALGTRT